MFGYPGETRETIEDTIKYSLKLPLDYAQYTVLVPFPDTEIYTYYQQNSDLGDYWAEVTRNPESEKEIALLHTKITRAEASELLGQAYRQFYFRPRIIWRRFVELRSGSEFMRLARAAKGILTNSIRGNINRIFLNGTKHSDASVTSMPSNKAAVVSANHQSQLQEKPRAGKVIPISEVR
jgi:radical SAM superfamily enzyme YgiQ (UPF0313 family)